ncbi:MAG: nuclear transport factor 2 family protein [Acidimicrobiia bacterium]|nr:nuclear transport factor 2 family protein [Acidimicrobiia bacterium]
MDVVRRFCDAWGKEDVATIVGFFTDDAVYHNIPIAPVTGPEQIKATIEGFSAGVESIEFQVDAIAANGPMVLTERVDIFVFPNGRIELPVMGAFEVRDGKIAAWRDYFDMNQFMSQMPTG